MEGEKGDKDEEIGWVRMKKLDGSSQKEGVWASFSSSASTAAASLSSG